MAQYKVPQDVEADDKLIGPFSFRQFVYLLIAGGLIALAVGLFQIFPLLAIIPLPPVLLFLALALPLKKDQPMETYLAALVSYYLKPRNRKWIPGQRDTTILITAPKIVEEARKRELSQEEATHRLSFLADIVDTEGQSIKGMGNGIMRDDLAAEANMAQDMFDTYHSESLNKAIKDDSAERHQEAIKEMRDAIARTNDLSLANTAITSHAAEPAPAVVPELSQSVEKMSSVIVQPEQKPEKPTQTKVNSSIMELANNSDFSVATIAKEANRIRKDNGEVFISLH